jgi:hypothetical protein
LTRAGFPLVVTTSVSFPQVWLDWALPGLPCKAAKAWHSNRLIVQQPFSTRRPLPYGGGGAIANYGTLAITNCTLSGNSAGVGGGIWNNSGTLAMTDSTLSANSALLYGGGIYQYHDVGGPGVRPSVTAPSAATPRAVPRLLKPVAEFSNPTVR